MIQELEDRYPLTGFPLVGEKNKKEFIALFGAVLRMKNLLTSFDEFTGNEILSEREFQDYSGKYLDLKDEFSKASTEMATDINDDVVFEIELIKQVEINIDYILILVQKYHDSHCSDKELLISIQKAVDSSPELRSKKALIESFIAGINEVEDVVSEWRAYIAEQKEKELIAIISSEKLNEQETRKFISDCFANGEVKTTGTDISKMLPPMSRFGNSNRDKKKERVIDKIMVFFDKFYGII